MKNKEDFNILIVDDEKDLLDSIATMLELEDYIIHKAESGNEAYRIFQKCNGDIDFILSDIRMPDGSGDELLKKLRTLNPDIPVILLVTGYSEFTNQEAIDAGAIGVFEKPIDFDKVIAEIEKVRLSS